MLSAVLQFLGPWENTNKAEASLMEQTAQPEGPTTITIKAFKAASRRDEFYRLRPSNSSIDTAMSSVPSSCESSSVLGRDDCALLTTSCSMSEASSPTSSSVMVDVFNVNRRASEVPLLPADVGQGPSMGAIRDCSDSWTHENELAWLRMRLAMALQRIAERDQALEQLHAELQELRHMYRRDVARLTAGGASVTCSDDPWVTPRPAECSGAGCRVHGTGIAAAAAAAAGVSVAGAVAVAGDEVQEGGEVGAVEAEGAHLRVVLAAEVAEQVGAAEEVREREEQEQQGEQGEGSMEDMQSFLSFLQA
ncbi:hypothetical protein Agub_g12550 [Astrephomene gubernaculifera]|uniref:Uncharacterized protein n=1 Tax=Astrephomene gubernaculifera TaxID=47775 RepID=A0AAD3E2V2_9CHLO|nr:hypothetical protein Agub_g12550 [Astrephomene gubernaculifera]